MGTYLAQGLAQSRHSVELTSAKGRQLPGAELSRTLHRCHTLPWGSNEFLVTQDLLVGGRHSLASLCVRVGMRLDG